MKKVYYLKLLILIIGVSFISCDKKKDFTCSEFEQNVFYEIFPSTIDSLFKDKRLSPPTPPPPGLTNEEFEQWMESEEHSEILKKWYRKRDSLKQDMTLVYLAISDSVVGFSSQDAKMLFDFYSNIDSSIIPSECQFEDDFKIDVTKLNSNNAKLRFKYRSEFPKGREFWRTDYEFFVGAKIGFSRILFDKTRSFGVLNAGYNFGILNGYGYRVFIRKNENGDWIIDKIKGTWIS